jgi:FkbM family methyltransferase
LLRNPKEKRIVDVKGFVQKWTESSNHRKDGEERIASCPILHPKLTNRLNAAVEASKYSFKPGQRVDLLKLDIQGYELRALQGARRTMDENPEIKYCFSSGPVGDGALRQLK